MNKELRLKEMFKELNDGMDELDRALNPDLTPEEIKEKNTENIKAAKDGLNKYTEDRFNSSLRVERKKGVAINETIIRMTREDGKTVELKLEVK